MKLLNNPPGVGPPAVDSVGCVVLAAGSVGCVVLGAGGGFAAVTTSSCGSGDIPAASAGGEQEAAPAPSINPSSRFTRKYLCCFAMVLCTLNDSSQGSSHLYFIGRFHFCLLFPEQAVIESSDQMHF